MRKIFTLLAFFVIGSLVFVLFQTDILIIGNQVGTEVGFIKEKDISAFIIKGGDVQYLEEGQVLEEAYPLLSNVNARLKISRIGIEGGIFEGTNESTLDKGFWHYPSASPYAEKGNVVIIGHRYLKLPPYRDTFYHLDRLKIGDEIQLNTDSKVFMYIVREKKVVSVEDTYVLQQTLNPQLTLITCHPLWTSAERLVIIADKVQETL